MILISASCSLWYLDSSECCYLLHHYHSARALLYLSAGLFPNIFFMWKSEDVPNPLHPALLSPFFPSLFFHFLPSFPFSLPLSFSQQKDCQRVSWPLIKIWHLPLCYFVFLVKYPATPVSLLHLSLRAHTILILPSGEDPLLWVRELSLSFHRLYPFSLSKWKILTYNDIVITSYYVRWLLDI